MTAACGNRFAPEVVYLTSFRDNVLAVSVYGREMVDLYYKVAPTIASVVRSHPLLRIIVRYGCLRPAVWLLKRSVLETKRRS